MTDTVEHPASQQEMPFAIVQGEPLLKLPDDLYIPPDALEVFLEAFEGPLDLLLYLIRRQNLDILDIPIAEVTRQYTGYIEMMTDMKLELAAEYLVMAAILAEIKSRMLLPRPQAEEEEEEDPRAELVRRLQEYERFKKAAEDLDELPRLERDLAVAEADVEERGEIRLPPEVDLREVLLALRDVMARAEMLAHHHIQAEPLSVRERMARIIDLVSSDQFVEFERCFDLEEGRRGAVVTFLALLELLREHLIDLVQQELFGSIYLRSPTARA
ncbi:segregation and condensation protein A [Wenzhouxiangella sp. AB-CW3]|uniref:segregation and condensation protein A n=1 Tax=Wenzhouxiangella sp. AB-CW3 TaxID=2771012 RepID=UPI001CC2F1EB|nr:segregation/condensation protein A [Wenzhouxiangella sp. AB-CW3]